MANLEFCDKHNMVAYLKKPTGSEGFQEIVDFLNGSHIRFALTKNPIIYVSLIGKFWHTATIKIVDNGEQEITATVDGKEFIITEASIRRHLQLADVEGISALPTTKIFDQLSLMEPIPNFVSSSHQKTQTPRKALNQVTKLPQTSEPKPNVANEVVYEEWDDRVERATTTAASLDAAQASGNITKTQSTAIPNVLFPQGIGAGGSSRCQEATGVSIAQTRSEKVPTQPNDSPLLRFNTVRSDEGSEEIRETVKSNQARRRAKIVVSDDEEDLEDSSKQGRMLEEIDQDARITLEIITDSAKAVSSKRGAEVGLDHEGSKKQKTNEASESVQEQPDEEEKELP
ncbi:hypothetical protein Tco_1164314 [Tanacetum coccineum]